MVQRSVRVTTGSVSGGGCAWCGGQLAYPGRGPRPTYCSQSCRQRSYELRRAERQTGRDLGAAAVSAPPERVVERVVERPYPTTAAGWADALAALAGQARSGQLRGDARRLTAACQTVLDALDEASTPPPVPARPRPTAPPVRPATPAALVEDPAGAAAVGIELVLHAQTPIGDDSEPVSVSADQLADRVATATGRRPVDAATVTAGLARLVATGRGTVWREIGGQRHYLGADEVARLAPHARVWIRGRALA